MNPISNTSLKILIVDDDELDRMTVRRGLKAADPTIVVTEAENASIALETLRKASFDCMILDYRLPGVDGLDLLKQIRILDISLPIIMMTGQSDERLIVDIMKAGATDYLSKSTIQPESLMASIRNAIRVQQAEQTIRESEGRFRTMADSTSVLLWIADAEGKRQFFNQSWLQFTGRPLAQEIGDTWQEAVHPEDLARYLSISRDCFSARQSFDIEYRLKRNDGEYRWILESAVPRLTTDGTFVGFIGSGIDLTERKRTEQQLEERTHQALLGAEVGAILTNMASLRTKLQRCSEAIVRHFDAAFARIWTLNAATNILELQASAGLYTNLDGTHSRVPVGKYKIGLIAQDRQPHLTNDVPQDTWVDQDWAANEKMQSFAGYPLIVQDTVVGVIAMFAHQPLSPSVLEAFSSIADEAALAILQARIAEDNERLYLQAQEAIQIREVFLSVASHELKTPLTSLTANIQLLIHRTQRENSLNERDQHTLTIVSEQAIRLNRLIGTLLDISRLQNGQLTIEHEQLDLGLLVRRLIEEMLPTLERHTIEFEDYSDPLPVLGDDLRLEQAIQNLLQNAIKYSPKGGVIRVKLGVEAGRAFVSVTDQGIGIPQEALVHLFDRFYRAPNAHERNISGLGLGLHVVKEIIGLHGGTIEVATVEGQGSNFSVMLPLYDRHKTI